MINRFDTIKEKTFGKAKEGINYYERVGVYGIVFNDIGQVAIMESPYGYFLPGGGLEQNETLEECLAREFKEELGCGISIKKFIGKATKYYYSEVSKQYRHPIGYFYLVSTDIQVINSIERDQVLLWMDSHECIKQMHEHQVWAIEKARQ
ncbi:MAG TPA: NUDIX domain-containing protein [Clostridia bacterium]|nr:NUDIX domain-containing protein [Clostridia bacterium]